MDQPVSGPSVRHEQAERHLHTGSRHPGPPAIAAIQRARSSAVVAALYIASGWLELLLLHRLGRADLAMLSPSLVVPWLPVGLAAAGLLHFGLVAWPGVFVGSAVLWGAIQGDPWVGVLPDAIGETASIVFIVAMLRRAGFEPRLDRYRDSVILVAILVVGRLIPAAVDVAIAIPIAYQDPRNRAIADSVGFSMSSWQAFFSAPLFGFLFRWWANSVVGGLVAIPLLQFVGEPKRAIGARPRSAAAMVVTLLSIWTVATLGLSGEGWRVAWTLATLVLVAWTAWRLGVGWAAIAIFVVSMGTTLAIAFHVGHFADITARETPAFTWGMLCVVTGVSWFLVGLIGQVERERRELAGLADQLRSLFHSSPFPIWIETLDGVITRANAATARLYGYRPDELQAARSSRLVAGLLDRRTMAGVVLAPNADLERHVTAAQTKLDVAVSRVPIETAAGSGRCCFVEPLEDRLAINALTIAAADLERFRLAGDLARSVQPAVRSLAQTAQRLAAELVGGRPVPTALLDRMSDDVADAVSECRRLTRGIAPYHGTDLLSALRTLGESAPPHAPAIDVRIGDVGATVLPAAVEEQVFRIAEEALSLAAGRRGTRRISISLDRDGPDLRLRVADDGEADTTAQNENALRSLHARTLAAGGVLHVEARAPRGTSVEFTRRAVSEDPPARGDADDSMDPPATTVEAAPDSGPALGRAAASSLARLLLENSTVMALCFVAGAATYAVAAAAQTRHASWDPGNVVVPTIADGLAVAGIWLCGYRVWPAVFVASILVWRGVAGDYWLPVLFDAAAQSAAAIVTVWLLRRWRFRPSFERFRDLGVLLGAAALGRVLPFAADTVAVVLLATVSPHLAYQEIGVTGSRADILMVVVPMIVEGAGRWWLGGTLAITLVVPAVVCMTAETRALIRQRSPEFFALGLLIAALAAVVITLPVFELRVPVLAIMVIGCLWASVRFGTPVGAMTSLLFVLAASAATALKSGIFANVPYATATIVSWRAAAVLVAISHFVSVMVAQERRFARDVRSVAREYQALFDAIPHAVFVFDRASGRVLFTNRSADTRFGFSAAAMRTRRITEFDADEGSSGKLMASPPPPPLEREFVTRSGDVLAVEITSADVEVDGRPARLCFAVDVGARQRLRRRLTDAGDVARRRLAGDLHDSLGQALVGLSLGVEVLRRKLQNGQRPAARDAQFIQKTAWAIEREADQLVAGVSPLAAADGDLVRAIRDLPQLLPPSDRLRFRVRIDGTVPVRLELPQKEHVYRIIRECCANALKHANAKSVTVSLSVTPDAIEAIVEDDGTGFCSTQTSRGLGLTSIASRAASLQAELAFEIAPGGGTRVRTRMVNGPRPVGS